MRNLVGTGCVPKLGACAPNLGFAARVNDNRPSRRMFSNPKSPAQTPDGTADDPIVRRPEQPIAPADPESRTTSPELPIPESRTPNPERVISEHPNAERRSAYLAWIAVCLIWGTTYLAIRIALESIPPLLMAAIRWIVAGGLLVIVLKLRGEDMPARRAWPMLTVLGVLLLGFGNGAVVWAEQTVPSGLTAVLVPTAPFWMVGIDALMPEGHGLTIR